MQPYSNDKSLRYWMNRITERQLKAVWKIITVVGLPDCALRFIFLFAGRKTCLLDTEQWGLWPVHYHRMHRYLRANA